MSVLPLDIGNVIEVGPATGRRGKSHVGNGMTDVAALTRMIEPEAQALGLALVRVKMIGGTSDPTLQVMAERPDTRQLSLEDCGTLSRRISDVLDAAEANGTDPFDGAYRLEVSSPGIDRPLTRIADYDDWAGHEARVTLLEPIDGRKQFNGALEGVDGDLVKVAGHALPFAAIRNAKLVLTDKLIKATRPLLADEPDDDVELEEIEDTDDGEDVAEEEGLD